MKITTGILFSGLIIFSGCTQTDSGNSGNVPAENNPAVVQPNPVNIPTDTNVQTATPGAGSNVPVSTESNPSSEKLNPAHGQPGHRCDIPVGSPLSSPPGNTSAAAPPVTTTPVKTAPGMNPPHGEPGHDCKIPVGSPLKK